MSNVAALYLVGDRGHCKIYLHHSQWLARGVGNQHEKEMHQNDPRPASPFPRKKKMSPKGPKTNGCELGSYYRACFGLWSHNRGPRNRKTYAERWPSLFDAGPTLRKRLEVSQWQPLRQAKWGSPTICKISPKLPNLWKIYASDNVS